MEVIKKVPSLRFPGFEGEWEIKKLGNISTIVGGGTPSKNEESYWNGNIPWISSSDISEENVREINVKKYITKSGLSNSSTKKCPSGTILIVSRVGVGKVALSKQEVCTSQDFANITYISEDSLFSTYSLSILLKKESNRTQGTSIKGITTDEIKGFKLLFPSLPEQQKIAACLTAMDDTIEAQQQKVEHLQVYKKGLLQQLFSQTLRFPGFEGEWEEKKLGEVGNTYTGLSGKTKENFGHGDGMFVTYMNVFSNTFSSINQLDKVEISESEKQNTLKKGDILFTTSSETPHEVGMSSCWNHDLENVYLNSFCFGYRLNKKEDFSPEFIAYNLRNSKTRKKISILAQGSTRFNLSKTELMKMTVGFPSLPEQQKIADCLSTLDEVIELEQQKLEKLQVYKKGLLQQLFV